MMILARGKFVLVQRVFATLTVAVKSRFKARSIVLFNRRVQLAKSPLRCATRRVGEPELARSAAPCAAQLEKCDR
jgi:hypothetical protein